MSCPVISKTKNSLNFNPVPTKIYVVISIVSQLTENQEKKLKFCERKATDVLSRLKTGKLDKTWPLLENEYDHEFFTVDDCLTKIEATNSLDKLRQLRKRLRNDKGQNLVLGCLFFIALLICRTIVKT